MIAGTARGDSRLSSPKFAASVAGFVHSERVRVRPRNGRRYEVRWLTPGRRDVQFRRFSRHGDAQRCAEALIADGYSPGLYETDVEWTELMSP